MHSQLFSIIQSYSLSLRKILHAVLLKFDRLLMIFFVFVYIIQCTDSEFQIS